MNGNETNGNGSQSNETYNQGGPGGAATASGTRTEEFKLSGDDIVGKIREIIEEGNARRIILRNAEGHNLIEIPLTVGLVGAALLPVYAALGAAVALAVNLTIVVEKRA
ncbi:MAG: DUF4342 domain-containing protein [Chloroflexota bacterium]|nr:DUF4342 domain-containing protein [Chloroflexota bacterium]MDQ5864922.1 DUF4342 domain-containing protein [Chloroflexota bacterium]